MPRGDGTGPGGMKQQAEYLKNTLDEIHKRIEQLEAEGKQQ